jgi:predicted esterase
MKCARLVRHAVLALVVGLGLACSDRRVSAPPRADGAAATSASTFAIASASTTSSPSISPSISVTPPAPKRELARLSGPWGVAYAPAEVPDTPPVLVYLHGSWSNAEESCSYFEPAAAGAFVLVCPHGNLQDASVGARGPAWVGTTSAKRAAIDRALAAASKLTPSGTLASTGGVLMGFSSGASCAVEIALAEPGRYRGLVLMAMSLSLSAPALKKAGVARVALGAAENDGSFGSLRATSRSLETAGFPVQFESFGAVGHHFAADMPTRMRDVVEWLRKE